ncbi:twin-arginine translocase TatA/TatE family subunit [Ningiella sp. W23]|uniref:twin-arginine translocase TatA/TatE family subunit n=1 Tax=Ningiella sp. W23 TaxID=3023715 RepID=UPI003757F3AF
MRKDMGLSIWQIALVVLAFVLLFGRGKISALMGDLALGIKSFKNGIKEDELNQQIPSSDDTAPEELTPSPQPKNKEASTR